MIEQYIKYVQQTVEKARRYANVIEQEGNSITPAAIMDCMAHYADVVIMLNAEYQRKKIAFGYAKLKHEAWYDRKLIETKRALMTKEGTESKTYKISLKEIESQLKVDHETEYMSQAQELLLLEHETSFLRRLQEDWKMVGQMYLGMSNNMRQEMKSYNLINSVERGDTNLRGEYPQSSPPVRVGRTPV